MSTTYGINGCIVSINVQSSTEAITECGDDAPLEGPTLETLNFTAYAYLDIWATEQAKAGLSINYIRKYDCVTDTVHFIANGQGQSYLYGNPTGVSLKNEFTTTTIISAAASANQTGVATVINQKNGFGLSYSGGPISIDTSPEMPPVDVGDFGLAYLQNFTFEAKAGQPPKVSYTFIRGISTQ
jgi:hypothetical protein